MKIYKILGKRGRITIPFAIRQELCFEQDDVISFEAQDDGSVIIRAEPRCCGCYDDQPDMIPLQDILDELPMEAKRDVMLYLSMQLAMSRRDNGNAR